MELSNILLQLSISNAEFGRSLAHTFRPPKPETTRYRSLPHTTKKSTQLTSLLGAKQREFGVGVRRSSCSQCPAGPLSVARYVACIHIRCHCWYTRLTVSCSSWQIPPRRYCRWTVDVNRRPAHIICLITYAYTYKLSYFLLRI